jgi:ABC-type bacteriocin/lantibiotic exporter with double-glycine peptidase domain
VLQNFQFGNRNLTQAQIEISLHDWGMLDIVNSFPNGLDTVCNKNMSLGQLQLVAVLQLCFKNPVIMLLDEPSAYMNEVYIDKVVDILHTHFKTNTIIFVTHDPRFASLASAILDMNMKSLTSILD